MSKVAFYVLALADGCYYVGISSRFEKRTTQHAEGRGAKWTHAHSPIEIVETVDHEVADWKEAERYEDLVTVRAMIRYGWKNVRGGHFCRLDEKALETDLRAHGYWDQVFQASISPAVSAHDWESAIDRVMSVIAEYHSQGCPESARTGVAEQVVGLRTHQDWRIEYEPALKEEFWGRKGVLPVLLTIKHGRPIGSKLQDSFAVLCAGLQRGRGGIHPWNHLFLTAWKAFQPPASDDQQRRAEEMLNSLAREYLDRQYDDFVTAAFPQMRWVLRNL